MLLRLLIGLLLVNLWRKEGGAEVLLGDWCWREEGGREKEKVVALFVGEDDFFRVYATTSYGYNY